MTREDAADLAVRAVRSLDRAQVRRLFHDDYAGAFHRLDDQALARRLALAIAAGGVQAPDGEQAPEPQWIHVETIDGRRALLSLAREVPGLERYEIDSLSQAAALAATLLADRVSRGLLLDIIEKPDHVRDRKTADDSDEAFLNAACAQRLYDRDVNLFTPRKALAAAVEAPVIIAPRAAPAPKEAQTDHWIEIVLKDEDGEPVADEPYRITLPSGDVRSGVLDGQGKARLDGLTEGGSAQVTFPQIDGREWRLA